jgi:chromosomal replication initiation ATPase DnaA
MRLNERDQERVNDILGETNRQLREVVGKPVSVIYRIRVNDISVQHVIQTVCRVCGVTWSQVLDKNKENTVLVPRQLIAWMLVKYCGLTHERVSKELNRGDHSTVTRMLQRVNEMIETSDPLYMVPLQTAEECILKLTRDQA